MFAEVRKKQKKFLNNITINYISFMKKEITINPEKTYTKTEYAKAFQISRPTIDKQIENKDLKIIEVNGVTLIVGK
jgi:hypothetical protein